MLNMSLVKHSVT